MIRLKNLAGNRITDEGFLKLHSQVHREQSRNLQACRDLLRQLILAALRPVVERKATRPTAGAKRRRLAEKKNTGEKKRNRSDRFET